jgi:hypothetical protein
MPRIAWSASVSHLERHVSGSAAVIQQLFKGHGVTDDPVGETHWKVSNGIRLTGMPAYTGSLTQAEMWQVSLLLANADKLPQQIRGILEPPLGVN